MKNLLKVIIILAYTLPFCFFTVSCDNIWSAEAFFSEEKYLAHKRVATQQKEEPAIVATTIPEIDSTSQEKTDTVSYDSTTPPILSTITDEGSNESTKNDGLYQLWFIILFSIIPNKLSGFGAILYYPNFIGQITITLTLLSSLLLFFEVKLKHTCFKVLHLYSFNLIGLLFVMLLSFVLSVDVKWGIVVLIILNGIGLYQTRKIMKNE